MAMRRLLLIATTIKAQRLAPSAKASAWPRLVLHSTPLRPAWGTRFVAIRPWDPLMTSELTECTGQRAFLLYDLPSERGMQVHSNSAPAQHLPSIRPQD